MFPFYVAITTTIEVLPWLLLFLLFFRKQQRFSFKVALLISCTYILCITLITCACVYILDLDTDFYLKWRFLLSLISTCCVVSICVCLVRSRITIILFVNLVIKNYLDASTLSFQILGKAVKLPALVSFCFLLIIFPLIYYFLIRLLKPIIENTSTMPLWSYLWLVPLSFYLLFRLGVMPGYMWNYDALGAISPILPFIWLFITLIIYYLILHILNESLKYTNLREQLRLSEIKAAAQEREYQHIQEESEKTKEIRKGLYQKLERLRQMAELNKIAELQDYLTNSLNHISQISKVTGCNNYAIDMVVKYYLNMAEENQIHITCKLDVYSYLPFSEIDVSIILGNLLENAVQACCRQKESKRRLSLYLKINNSKLLCSVENSFSGQICRRGDLFLSSKRDGPGLGIASVKSIIEKHDGVLQIRYEQQTFCVDVMLENTRKEAMTHD